MSSFYDWLFGTAVAESVIGVYGHAYSANSLQTFNSLIDVMGNRECSRPHFVFAHLMIPHSPFFLDESCLLDTSHERLESASFQSLEFSRALDSFLTQMACASWMIERVTAAADDEDVVVFVSDHGTDRRKQELLDGDRSAGVVFERYSILAAARVNADCELGASTVSVNVMRRVLSCHSRLPMADLPPRIWMPDGELEPDQVSALMTTG